MKKFKFLIVALTTFLLVGVVGVSATGYSPEFEILTSDGTVTVPVINDQAKSDILADYLYSLSTADYWFSADYETCTNDYTVCNVILFFSDGRENESHEVQISYEETYTDAFKAITDNGKLEIETMLIDQPLAVVDSYITSYNDDINTFYYEQCNEDYSLCKIFRYSNDGNEYESHQVEITYKEVYSDTFKELFTDNKKLTIETTIIAVPANSLEKYITSYNTEKEQFILQNCNEGYSVCTICRSDESGIVESHEVEITYKEVYTDEFKELLTDKKLVVPVMNFDSRDMVLGVFIGNLSTEEFSYYYTNCNEDYSVCDIEVFSMTEGLFEQHTVNISYKEVYTDEFKTILSDGKLVVTESDLEEDKIWVIRTAVSNFDTDDYMFNIDECNEDYSVCTVSRYSSDGIEQHKVSVVYKEKYSDLYQNLTKDGTITITSSTVGDIDDLIWSYVNNAGSENFGFYPETCNDDFTKCAIRLNHYETNKSETHVINIKYDEKYSKLFDGVITNGKIIIPSIKPKDQGEAEFFLQNYLNTISTADYEFSSGVCNDDYTICDIAVWVKQADGSYTSEMHKATVTYDELDQNKANQVNKVLASIPDDKTFVVEDLEVINYIVNSGYTDDALYFSAEAAYINYSTELKELLGNSNITAALDIRGGKFPIFIQENIGAYVLSYDGVAYGLFHGGAVKNYVIYVSDDTKESTDAYMKAAQDRLDAYLGAGKVELSYGGKLSDLDESDHDLLGYGDKLRDEYFTLTYGDFDFMFLIIKDSSKIQDIGGQTTNDVMTNISISMDSSVLPLDTSIQVDEISKDNQKYTEITNKLIDNKYNVDNALIYDLKLYSFSNKDYITKLKDGTFEVKIPVSKDLEGKDLIVYYVNEDGKVDEHEVTPEGGYAVFTTNHFSIYTLAENKPFDFENPNTFDGISTYFMVGLVSLVGLVGTILYSRKNNKAKDC